MVTLRDEHPDEGKIHTWLDGELDATSAAALEAHVAGCAECRARVAEARGLIAGASRVVGALDDAPSGTSIAWGSASPAIAPVASDAGSVWRILRVTPARATIAAMLLVAIGLTLTHERTGPDTVSLSSRPSAGAAASEAASPAAVFPNDHLLDSAVARNLAAVQPPRAVRAAPGPDIPTPPNVSSTAASTDTSAATRVAVARATVRAQRETSGAAADKARVSGVTDAPTTDRTVAAAKRADSMVSAPPALRTGAAAAAPSAVGRNVTTPEGECYRVESATGITAAWGSVPLPFVVALDAQTLNARVLTSAGGATDSRASWTRSGEDSLVLRLQRIGYQGSLTLGATGASRSGVMRSNPTQATVQDVATGAAEQKPSAARRARTPAPVAATAPDRGAVSAAPAVPVVATRVGCPSLNR